MISCWSLHLGSKFFSPNSFKQIEFKDQNHKILWAPFFYIPVLHRLTALKFFLLKVQIK